MKIHHIGYLVRNLVKAEAGLLNLGFSIEQSALHDPVRKINASFLINGDYRIELVEPDNKSSPMYPLLKRFTNSPYHICYQTKDIKDAINKFCSTGYHLIKPPALAPLLSCPNIGNGGGGVWKWLFL